MGRTFAALICAISLGGCSPVILAGAATRTDLIAMLYVGSQLTPQWADKIYSEQIPVLATTLKLHFPDEYWSAMTEMSVALRSGKEVVNPLMARFGHYAAFADDDTHHEVLDTFLAYLAERSALGGDYCFSEDSWESDFEATQMVVANAVAEGIENPTQRQESNPLAVIVIAGHLAKRGLDLQKLQAAALDQFYPEACDDYIAFLKTLNSLDMDEARLMRANIIGAMAPHF